MIELTELLEIDRSLIKWEDEQGLQYAELLFKQAGAPTDRRRLHNTLEHILIVCRREGVRYPPVLLLRFKNIERGLWEPKRKSPVLQVAPDRPAAASSAMGKGCALCHGTGLRAVREAKGYVGVPCDCQSPAIGVGKVAPGVER